VKKFVVAVLASFLLIAYSNSVWAAIEGDWDVNIVEKTRVKVKGEKAETHSETYKDVFSFKSNNDFYMLGKYFGTWQQVRKKYIVNIDPQVFADHVMELEGSEEVQSVTMTAGSFVVKMNKDGTIRGKFKINAIFEIENTPSKFKLNSTFTGTMKIDGEPSTEEFVAQTKTIAIDGNYDDWDINDRVYNDTNGSDCNNVAGRDIQEVYVAQDDTYIYLRFILNSPYPIQYVTNL